MPSIAVGDWSCMTFFDRCPMLSFLDVSSQLLLEGARLALILSGMLEFELLGRSPPASACLAYVLRTGVRFDLLRVSFSSMSITFILGRPAASRSSSVAFSTSPMEANLAGDLVGDVVRDLAAPERVDGVLAGHHSSPPPSNSTSSDSSSSSDSSIRSFSTVP